MNLTLAYRGRSAIVSGRAGLAVSLAPNLRRDRVAFDGTLRHPVRFREAIGALHDIVVSDLRFMPRDKSAYEAYAAEQKRRQGQLRQAVVKQARTAILDAMPELPDPYPDGFDRHFREMRKLYWKAREKYSQHLVKHDPELWRLLMPCDPVITVAPDVLFFECFSADESSYGCLTVGRDAFSSEREAALDVVAACGFLPRWKRSSIRRRRPSLGRPRARETPWRRALRPTRPFAWGWTRSIY